MKEEGICIGCRNCDAEQFQRVIRRIGGCAGMIYNLQLLRGLAALGVSFYHSDFQIVRGISTEFYGVSIFFAISGFIITHVTRQDSTGFLLKRLVRVVPLYWIATAVFFIFTPYTWPHLLESLLFVPADKPPVLRVGWTLNYEMFFYVLFGVALAISKRWAPLIAAVVLLLLQAVQHFAPCGRVCSTYGGRVTGFFVIGIALYYVWLAARLWMPPLRRTMKVVSAIVAGGVVTICVAWHEPPAAVALIIVTAVLLTALLAEASGLACRNRALLALGGMSYSLYLTHLMVIEPMRIVATKLPWLDQAQSIPVMLASVGMSVLLAYVVFRFIETPMLAGFRALIQIRRRPIPTPP